MKIRISHWLWVVLLVAASVMLYHTSYQVQQLETRIAQLDRQRATEQERIHVLEAEWAALTAPARLQRLADKYLPLRPLAAAQIVPAHKLARVLPHREDGATLAQAQTNTQQRLAMATPRGAEPR